MDFWFMYWSLKRKNFFWGTESMLFDYNKHTIEKNKMFHLNRTYSFLQTETTIYNLFLITGWKKFTSWLKGFKEVSQKIFQVLVSD